MKRSTHFVHVRWSPDVPFRKLEVRGTFQDPEPAKARCTEWLVGQESLRGKLLKSDIKPEAVVVEFVEEHRAECATCRQPLYGSDMVWLCVTKVYCGDCQQGAKNGMWTLLDDALSNEQDARSI